MASTLARSVAAKSSDDITTDFGGGVTTPVCERSANSGTSFPDAGAAEHEAAIDAASIEPKSALRGSSALRTGKQSLSATAAPLCPRRPGHRPLRSLPQRRASSGIVSRSGRFPHCQPFPQSVSLDFDVHEISSRSDSLKTMPN
ncbi:hypothetical protein ACFORO_21585 [Amycolatopsis halotolerans]|uniref:Uncharacterized protein n=1 Tax=Amycolatopsis halotolerans TaxID=330083 RepID=A0ABV7QHG0_9PSEU